MDHICLCLTCTRDIKTPRQNFFDHIISLCNRFLFHLVTNWCLHTALMTLFEKEYGDTSPVWCPLPFPFTLEGYLCSSSTGPLPGKLFLVKVSARYLFSVRLLLTALFSFDTTHWPASSLFFQILHSSEHPLLSFIFTYCSFLVYLFPPYLIWSEGFSSCIIHGCMLRSLKIPWHI